MLYLIVPLAVLFSISCSSDNEKKRVEDNQAKSPEIPLIANNDSDAQLTDPSAKPPLDWGNLTALSELAELPHFRLSSLLQAVFSDCSDFEKKGLAYSLVPGGEPQAVTCGTIITEIRGISTASFGQDKKKPLIISIGRLEKPIESADRTDSLRVMWLYSSCPESIGEQMKELGVHHRADGRLTSGYGDELWRYAQPIADVFENFDPLVRPVCPNRSPDDSTKAFPILPL